MTVCDFFCQQPFRWDILELDLWTSILESTGATALANFLSATSWEILSQKQLAKPVLNSWSTETEIINICCYFKLLKKEKRRGKKGRREESFNSYKLLVLGKNFNPRGKNPSHIPLPSFSPCHFHCKNKSKNKNWSIYRHLRVHFSMLDSMLT